MTRKINKMLIANRGEIACRIERTCREMGIKTVAVYSQADAGAKFVREADEAYAIGAAPAAESYLNSEKIMAVAKKVSADAIHPGYGFLSERPELSAACEEAGLIFLGPSPKAIAAMGDKVNARTQAKAVHLPCVPGGTEAMSDSSVKEFAQIHGYPVLIKAIAGGGGKGMRKVRREDEVEQSFALAASEALKAFGDGRLYVEKFINEPRHIEVQIARDENGSAVHIFERECSLQRRHQKVIEEAPCVDLPESVRQDICAAAVKLAEGIAYTGVGTVEFLVDQSYGFYFLEMNTRLQVEHGVTEMIVGLDLVRLQILIGEGGKLPRQQEIQRRGHAVECRIYAEDPRENFIPSPGRIHVLRPPQGAGIRHETGYESGDLVPQYYDPLIAKLLVWDETRERALARMGVALRSYCLLGVKNNVVFLQRLLHHPAFVASEAHTQFIDQHPETVQLSPMTVPRDIFLAAAALAREQRLPVFADTGISAWHEAGLREALNQRP